MKVRRKRLKARDLMIVIAAFALSLKLGLAYSRSASYWKEANFYGNALASARPMADLLQSEYRPPRILGSQAGGAGTIVFLERDSPKIHGVERKQAAEGALRYVAYLERMRAKYRRAAFLPWLPNAPEPPRS